MHIDVLVADASHFVYAGAEGKTNGQLTPADLKHTSLGNLGNLCTDQIRLKMESAAQFSAISSYRRNSGDEIWE